ncbi:MAG: hypothetical protein QOG80_2533 [Pseudonocardiales bacterium]|nr:hypothetical protein [Pseudonocardiales bacterium]
MSGTAIASAKGTSPAAYTCTNGDIQSGSYASITVTGFCEVADNAVITVVGNVDVAAGAFLDAQSAPSTITVGHNVTAAAGSLLGLGCQPFGYVPHAAHPCTVDSDGHSVITVNGNVTATDADTVLLNGITVNGNVTLTGGGGPIPWAEKNNTIGGNLTISNVTPDWLGVLFNHIAGNATLTNITATDPEDDGNAAVSVVVNTIGRNLNCTGLGPRLSGGAIPGEVNFVGHNATGQCAALV